MARLHSGREERASLRPECLHRRGPRLEHALSSMMRKSRSFFSCTSSRGNEPPARGRWRFGPTRRATRCPARYAAALRKTPALSGRLHQHRPEAAIGHTTQQLIPVSTLRPADIIVSTPS
jgi:hypothetical protein